MNERGNKEWKPKVIKLQTQEKTEWKRRKKEILEIRYIFIACIYK